MIVYKPFISSDIEFDPIPISHPISKYSANPDSEIIPVQGVAKSKSETEKPKSKKSNPTKENLSSARTIIASRTSKGNHQFKIPDIQVGELQGFLDMLADNKIYVRVTSGIRPGAVTPSGNKSRHDDGHAIDITPIEGDTWEGLITKIRNCPEALTYMVDNGIGWLNEISKEDQEKYDATNANVHISARGKRGYPEEIAIKGRKETFGV